MQKVLLSLIMAFISLGVIAQNLQDTIITKTGDTIKCEITFMNDDNIFYKYKQKRKLRSKHISKKNVYHYSSSKIEKVSFNSNSRTVYRKCDTCKNWLVTMNNDSIFYNLIPHPLCNDAYLFSHVACSDSNSVIIFEIPRIKSMMWNGFAYRHISDKDIDIKHLPYTLQEFINRDQLMGYYRVKGKVSLIKSGYPVKDMPLLTISSYSLKSVYFLEIDNKLVYMSRIKKEQATLLKELLKDNHDIIAQIRDEGINLFEIVKLLERYNQEAKN